MPKNTQDPVQAPEEIKAPVANDTERAKEVFATHSVNEIYFTSDGTCFIEEQHARMHASFLKDDLVKPVKRQEV